MADKQPEALRALVLADEYARTKAKANLESIYGTSPSYSSQCEEEAEEARNALKDELSSQHALIAELVGALEGIEEAVESMQNTFGKLWGATPEDDDTYIHEKWAEDFLKERLAPVVAALAKAKEQQ
jgi:hypothetical protein